jgi:hypothetical protein
MFSFEKAKIKLKLACQMRSYNLLLHFVRGKYNRNKARPIISFIFLLLSSYLDKYYFVFLPRLGVLFLFFLREMLTKIDLTMKRVFLKKLFLKK